MRPAWPRKSKTNTARSHWKAYKKSVSSLRMNRQFRDLRPIDGNVGDASATGSKRRDWHGTVALECPLSRRVAAVERTCRGHRENGVVDPDLTYAPDATYVVHDGRIRPVFCGRAV